MITVNQHEKVPWHEQLTVRELLVTLKYSHRQLIVSINGVLVAHDSYARTPIPDRAEVRVIHLMAGG
ncbi:MAG TPA: sulfur carrier protein ThiS [Thermoflexia bacterium]|nr:sulfur carrier protein ThiS [Thermoflexia bacterium]